jgi:predicted porin
MKNKLLCTSALALTGFAGAASAAEISAGAVNMGFSGYYSTALSYASVDTGAKVLDTDFDGVDVWTNAEIHFTPAIVLDNGVKVGINIQLEGDTASDQIDEQYMQITGDFGQVLIGSENSAGYKMQVVAPDVSHIAASSSSLTAYVPYSGSNAGRAAGNGLFRGTLGTTYIENVTNNDAARLTYFSPRFGGLQLGASYARDGSQSNGAVDNNATVTDIWDFGLNYGGTWGDVSVDGSARYGIASGFGGSDDPEIWGLGLSMGFGGFTFGGSYAEQNDAGKFDGKAYDVGMGYSDGPMSYSLTYFLGESVNDENIALLNAGDEELETIMLAVKYQVAAGFSVGAFLADTQFSEDFDDDGAAGGGDDVEGTVLGVSASFSF